MTYATQWKVIESRADKDSAWVTSRLEFWREPSWMAQFPFAHTIDMTYRLRGGVLEVATAIENLSSEPMPISVGYHPYFQVADAPRDEWTVSVAARREWLLSPDKLPTGETRPIEQFFPNPAQIRLGDFDLDHVFDDLVRDPSGRAVMSVKGKSQRIDVTFGPNYRAAVLYAPLKVKEFICFEPMVAISNAMNLAQRGVYKELQTVAPGQTWRESFWIPPSPGSETAVTTRRAALSSPAARRPPGISISSLSCCDRGFRIRTHARAPVTTLVDAAPCRPRDGRPAATPLPHRPSPSRRFRRPPRGDRTWSIPWRGASRARGRASGW